MVEINGIPTGSLRGRSWAFARGQYHFVSNFIFSVLSLGSGICLWCKSAALDKQ